MSILNGIGLAFARYLDRPIEAADSPFTPRNPTVLHTSLMPGDVILVEGNNIVSAVIKHLTQSAWSHAALYVGHIQGAVAENGEPHVLVEANIGEGVISAPLSKYFRYHTRICRPIALSVLDREEVRRYAVDRIGLGYDLKNIIDLLKYLLPLPAPRGWRRRLNALGSRDPSRIMCSALIAQAFNAVRHPILSRIKEMDSETTGDAWERPHCSFYTPSDFDLSPYFEVLKTANSPQTALPSAQPALGKSSPGASRLRRFRVACSGPRRTLRQRSDWLGSSGAAILDGARIA